MIKVQTFSFEIKPVTLTFACPPLVNPRLQSNALSSSEDPTQQKVADKQSCDQGLVVEIPADLLCQPSFQRSPP